MTTRELMRRRKRPTGPNVTRRRSDQKIRFEWALTEKLTENPFNTRKHTEAQETALLALMEKHGFTSPIVADRDYMVICGHLRLKIAKRLGLKRVPVVLAEHLTDEQIRIQMIADNRVAELADWDYQGLAIEFQSLLSGDIDIDLSVTGFDVPEVDFIIGNLQISEEDDTVTSAPLDVLPLTCETAACEAGDIWIAGNHRLFVGDARKKPSYDALLSSAHVKAVITDPPYNRSINGDVGGRGNIKHREFLHGSGEMSDEEFTGFVRTSLGHMHDVCVEGALIYVAMDWHHQRNVWDAAQDIGLEQINLCVWRKKQPGMGGFYRSQHELFLVFRKGNNSHTNNVQLGRHGRNRSNVWDYPGISTPTKANRKLLALHPTVKPVALVADAIRDCTRHGDLVLDPFAGSGTILLACELTSRCARAIEIDPLYADVAITRWQDLTGRDAIHEATGETFTHRKRKREAA